MSDIRTVAAAALIIDEPRLRYVPCECCHGTGEIICRDGEYRSGWPEPIEYALICSACEGYGMDCVETEDAGIEHTEQT